MKTYFFSMILGLLVAGPACAQQEFPSLESCIRFAFQHRPDLENERLSETVAQNGQKLATSALLPQLKAVSALDDYLSLPVQLIPAELLGGTPGEFARVQFGTQYNFTYGLEAQVPLLNLPLWQSRQQAEAEAQVAKYQKFSSFQVAAEQIARAYYLTLLTREAAGIALENVEVNDTLLQTAGYKFQNGILEPLEFNRLKALQLETRQTWLDNQTAYQRNLLQLKVLLGLPATEPVTLTETLANVAEGAIMLAALPEESNQYLATQWRLRVAEQAWEKQKSRIAPEISGYGRYTRQSQSNTLQVLHPDIPWFEIAVIGLRLDWPLFTGFNRRVSLKQASLNRRIAENALKQQGLQTTREYAELQLNYQNSQNSLETYREHYKLYQDNYALARYKYQQDVYSTDQLLQVYAEKLRSQNQYLTAMGNYYISRTLIQLKNEFSKTETDRPYETR